jgi:trk system potassium uptake protein TrkA
VTVSPAWIGEPVKAVEASSRTRIAFIDRLGEAIVPQPGTVLQHGDVVHVIAKESELDQISASFATRGSGY